MEHKYSAHITTTGEQVSIFRVDENVEVDHTKRVCCWQEFVYGHKGTGKVKISYGIQGFAYFKALRSVFEKVMADTYCVMGFIWEEHVEEYKEALAGLALVEVLWVDYPYDDGVPRYWTIVRKIDEDGQIVGPKAVWDK